MNRQDIRTLFPKSLGSWMRRGAVLAAAVVVVAVLVPQVGGAPAASTAPAPGAQPAALTIKGTCVFGGKPSTWSATLTPKGDNLYDAAYISSWGGKPLEYKGTIKSDFKTDIIGEGTATKGGNGTFQFSGKYGNNGTAQCNYKEEGGRGRSGTLTAEQAKNN